MLRLLLLIAFILSLAAPAEAFVIGRYAFQPCPFPCPTGSNIDVERSLREAPRWDAGTATFADGLRVSIAPGFGQGMALLNPLVGADYEQGVIDAFAAWETPDLGFDLSFDDTGFSDIRIDVTDSRTDPDFQGNSFSGLAFVSTRFAPDRQLTSGIHEPGHIIHTAELRIATDRVRQAFNVWVLASVLEESQRLDRFTNLMMHEIGHALGLGHPNENPTFNFDDDGDPFTVFEPNPLAPHEGLSLSENFDPGAIMHGGGLLDFEAIVATELFPDDRSGLNFLYPSIPEPAVIFLLGSGLLALARRKPRPAL